MTRWGKRRLLVFACCLLVVGTLALLLPRPGGPTESVPLLPFFPDEPLIDVLLARIPPGGDLTISGDEIEIRGGEGGLSRASGPVHLRAGETGVILGGRSLDPPIEIAGREDRPLEVRGRRYPGRLRLLDSGDELLLINRLPVDTYVAGVIIAEMGTWFPDEALKAQAVASRSYALHRLRRRRSQPWHVGTTQRTQVYRGVPPQPRRVARIVGATAGIVLALGDRIVPGFFSSTCGGHTRPAAEAFGGETLPPLSGVPCAWCRRAPLYRWKREMPLDGLRKALSWRDPIVGVGAILRTPSGRLRSLMLIQEEESHEIPFTRLRKAWSGPLPSSWIVRAVVSEGTLILEGRGFGHGVGLCQFGARSQALAGRDHEAILSCYFPGARLVRAWPADT